MSALKGGQHQHEEMDDQYTIWFYDGPEVHFCTVWRGEVPHGIVACGYSQEQNDADKLDFETTYKLSGNKTLEPKTADGRIRSAAEKTSASKANFFSHDWSDPTTWYQSSIRIVDETLTDQGAHTTYGFAHTNVIDLYHGLLHQEDYILDAGGFTYRVAVKVNGTAKAEQDPHYGSGGDYTINYAAGTLTFLSALQPGDAVTATYHYATNSVFTITPATGKALSVQLVECQFSADIVMTDSIVFQPYGFVESFAPQYAYWTTTGTTSFTNGSTAITGSGTTFTAKVKAGHYVRLQTDGAQYNMVVASVDSDTGITLAAPYTGTTGTGTLIYSPSATDIYPAGTKIPLGNPIVYKSMGDFQNEATRAYPTYPLLGGSSWRGMTQGIVVFDWDYISSTVLRADTGMEVRLRLQHDVPFGGFYATATFYCTSDQL